jgi:hypothetical protein
MTYKSSGALGLVPQKHIDGTAWNGGTMDYPISSGYSTGLFNGDPVTTLADGTIGIGVAGAAILGVFNGCEYTASDGEYRFLSYWPASTTVYTGTVPIAHIIIDPTVVFTIQEAGPSATAGTPLALADRGLNANFASGTGSTATGQSGFFLNNSTEDTTATLNLKIMALDSGNPLNTTTGAYSNWLVIINNHQLKGGTGTLGV